jgi:general secretion pathway protein I
MPARAERGFTLLEMLVALAVLSLGAVALLNLAGENTRQAGAVESRFFAAVVAENQAIAAMTSGGAPAIGVQTGEEAVGRQAWRWTRTVAPLSAGVLRIEVRVTPAAGGPTVGEVTVFRGGA